MIENIQTLDLNTVIESMGSKPGKRAQTGSCPTTQQQQPTATSSFPETKREFLVFLRCLSPSRGSSSPTPTSHGAARGCRSRARLLGHGANRRPGPQGRQDAAARLPPPPVGVNHALRVGATPAAGITGGAAATSRSHLRGSRPRRGRRAYLRVARRAVLGRGAAQ